MTIDLSVIMLVLVFLAVSINVVVWRQHRAIERKLRRLERELGIDHV